MRISTADIIEPSVLKKILAKSKPRKASSAPAEPAVPPAAPSVQLIPLLDITITGTNPRTTFPDDYIAELADSIGQIGIQTPLWVCRSEDGPGYDLIAGECRYRAAKRAMLSHVPCLVKEVDEKGFLELQILENLHRREVSPIEEGRGFQRLLRDHGYTIEQLMRQLNKSKSYIYGRVKLADLPKLAQEALAEGTLSPSVALRVARIPGATLQAKALKEIIATPHLQTDRGAADLIEQKFCRELKGAPFDPADKTLQSDRGACKACPYRSGNQTDLFPGQVAGRGDICTDPECYQAKSDLSWSRLKLATIARGGEAFEGDDARKIFSYGYPADRSWMRMDWDIHQYAHRTGPTLDELLADAPPVISVLRTAEGVIMRLARRADVEQIMAARGIVDPDGEESAADQEAREQEWRRKDRERQEDAAVAVAVEAEILHAVTVGKVNFLQEDKLLVAVIKALLHEDYSDTTGTIIARLGLLVSTQDDEDPEESSAVLHRWFAAGRWVRADLQAILLQVALAGLYGEEREEITNEVARLYEVDTSAIEQKARAAFAQPQAAPKRGNKAKVAA